MQFTTEEEFWTLTLLKVNALASTIPVFPIEYLLNEAEIQSNRLCQNIREIVGEKYIRVVCFFLANASRFDQTQPRTLHVSGPAAARKSTLVSYMCSVLASSGDRALSKQGLPGQSID